MRVVIVGAGIGDPSPAPVPEFDLEGPALFLASPASDFMTGQTLVVDGGCLAK